MQRIDDRIGGTANRARSRRDLARRRGSAVLLVVVSLVLMALMGAAYLQQTRVQRFAVSEPAGCSPRVVQAIVDQIAQAIKADLPSNRSPNAGFALYDYPWTNPSAAPNNEWTVNAYDSTNTNIAYGGRYDRPWLASHTPDYDGNGQNPIWQKITNLNGIFLNYNRETDEFILESPSIPEEHFVDFSGGTPPDVRYRDSWLEININPDGTTPNSGFRQLVDATGDGIPDSRWTWAPIRECSDTTYVMAVRIVDLGGMLNVNTAMSLIDDSGAFNASTNAPRWDTPSELDLGGLVYSLARDSGIGANGTGTWRDEAMEDLDERLLAYRFGDHHTPGLPVSRSDRRSFWNNQGRRFSAQSGYGYFTRADEYELRHRFGLHSGASNRPITGASTGLHGFLRGDGDEEQRFTSAMGFVAPDYSRYADPSLGGSLNDDWYFFHREPRKLLTTMNGAMPLVWPRVPSEPFRPNERKLNVNSANVRAVAEQIRKVLDDWGSNPSIAAGFELPGGYSIGNATDRAHFAFQYAVNLLAYRSPTADGLIPLYEITQEDLDAGVQNVSIGDTFYGFKPLPILTEVYTQAKYEGNWPPAMGDPTGGADPDEHEWELDWRLQGPVGFAIEVRNPYNVPVDLRTVHLVVTVDSDAEDWGSIADLTDRLPDTPRKNTLAPGEVLIFYRNSDGGDWNTDDTHRTRDDIREMIDNAEADNQDDDITVTKIPVPEGVAQPVEPENTSTSDLEWPESTTGAREDDVMVSLRPWITPLDDDPDNDYPADWSYSEFPGARYPQDRTTTIVADQDGSGNFVPPAGVTVASTLISYDQHTRHGGSRGLNILDVDPMESSNEHAKSLHGEESEPAWDANSPTAAWHDESIPQLAKEDKLDNSDPGSPVDTLELRERQQLIFRGGRLDHVGEMLFVTPLEIHPDGEPLTGEVWRMQAAGGSTRHVNNLLFSMVPGNNNVLVEDGSDYTIAPAALLLDQFSTVSPEERNTIPGLLNVNTVPRHLLEQILPIPNDWLRYEVAQRIVAYRDGDPGSSMSLHEQRVELINAIHGSTVVADDQVRANPGIAHIGELYPLFTDIFKTSPVASVFDVVSVSAAFPSYSAPPVGSPPSHDGDTFWMNNNSSQVRVDFLNDQDGIANDREEEAMLFNWLAEVMTTRSDYFAAYVVLRGYDSDGGFTSDDIRDIMRFIVLYRREVESGNVKVVDMLSGNDVYEVR